MVGTHPVPAAQPARGLDRRSGRSWQVVVVALAMTGAAAGCADVAPDRGDVMDEVGDGGSGSIASFERPTVVEACSEAALAPCFVNEDCGAGLRCEDVGRAGVAVPCCVAGPRGHLPVGADCQTENDCAAGLCVGEARRRCSAECMGDTCPVGMECNDILAICVPLE